MRRINLTVRPVSRGDVENLLRFYSDRGVEYQKNGLEKKLSGAVEDITEELFVAVRGNRLAGCIHLRLAENFHEKDYVEIADFFVCEDCRRLGIGDMLLGAAECWCRQSFYAETRFLRADAFPLARAFLLKNGYRELGAGALGKILYI